MKAHRLPAASPTDNKAVIVTAPTTGVRGSTSNATALQKSHTPGGWITRAADPVVRATKASVLDADAQTLDFERQQLSALLRKLEQDASAYESEQEKLRDSWSNAEKD